MGSIGEAIRIIKNTFLKSVWNARQESKPKAKDKKNKEENKQKQKNHISLPPFSKLPGVTPLDVGEKSLSLVLKPNQGGRPQVEIFAFGAHAHPHEVITSPFGLSFL